MFFAYGSGANGKSVLTATATGIMGDYHTTAPIETFVATSQERHPTDLAGLRGARLVTVTETEGGRRWAEAKIKTLTGGDRISARFMRQDFFEFLPHFKLWIAGNHKPHLRSVDDRHRRLHELPGHLIPGRITKPRFRAHLAGHIRPAGEPRKVAYVGAIRQPQVRIRATEGPEKVNPMRHALLPPLKYLPSALYHMPGSLSRRTRYAVVKLNDRTDCLLPLCCHAKCMHCSILGLQYETNTHISDRRFSV
jgi:Family of unknown function (DUF5906)